MKTKLPVHTVLFGVVISNSDVMPPFFNLHGFKLKHARLHRVPGGGWADLNRESGYLHLATGRCAMPHKQETLVLDMSKFLWPHCLSCLAGLTPFTCYVLGAVEQETNKTQCTTKDELKPRIMAALTNLNNETIGKACRRLQSCLCPVGWGCRIHRLLLCREVRPPTPNECPGYDTKQSDGEVPVVLKLWGMLYCHRSQVHSGPEW